MKAKKLIALGLSSLAVISLASCSDDTEARKQALAKVANQGIATYANGIDMIAGTETRLNANNGDTISLAKQSQTKVNGVTYTVQIEWSYDQATYGQPGAASSCVRKFEDDMNDPTHLFVAFNYSLDKEQAFAFSGKLTCGEGVSTTVEYSCTLSKLEITFTEFTHEEFYSKGTNGKFVWQNDEGRQKDYYYRNGHNITIYGKLTYKAQDGNFGFISNGDRNIALYHTELSSYASEFVVGRYLTVSGYIATYCGYPQLSNQIEVRELTPEEVTEKVVEPTNTITSTSLVLTGANMTGDAKFDQFSDYQHKFAKVSGTYVANSLEGKGAADGTNRFTFKLHTADDKDVVVQWNYHADSGSGDIGGQIVNKVKAAGSSIITVTGAMTYAATDASGQTIEKAPETFEPGNVGYWTIEPVANEAVVIG